MFQGRFKRCQGDFGEGGGGVSVFHRISWGCWSVSGDLRVALGAFMRFLGYIKESQGRFRESQLVSGTSKGFQRDLWDSSSVLQRRCRGFQKVSRAFQETSGGCRGTLPAFKGISLNIKGISRAFQGVSR